MATFLIDHLGTRFLRPPSSRGSATASAEVKAFANDHDIPILRLKNQTEHAWTTESSTTCVPPRGSRAEGRYGVVAIVPPRSSSGSSAPRRSPHAARSGSARKEERRVGVYYFYVLDPEFGPGFIKLCTYFPYPAKVWLNGHEWAKRQARRAGSLSPSWPTASPPVPIVQRCRPSVTASALLISRRSSTGGPDPSPPP